MRPAPQTFLAACLAGQATADQIDDWVEQWHTSPDTPVLGLQETLGLTAQEYERWLKNPDAITAIIASHQNRLQ